MGDFFNIYMGRKQKAFLDDMCCYDEQALIIDIRGERESSTHSEGLWWYHGNHESKARVVCDDGRYVHSFTQAVPLLDGLYVMEIHLLNSHVIYLHIHTPERLLRIRIGQLSCTKMGRTNRCGLQASPQWNEAEFPSSCYKGNSCAAREEPAGGWACFPKAIGEIFIRRAEDTGWFMRGYS